MTGGLFQDRIQQWGKLPEHNMRRLQLERYLQVVSAPTAVQVLEELVVHARERSAHGMRLYMAVVELMETADWFAGVIPDWRRAAMARGHKEVQYLLMDPPPQRMLDEEEEAQSHPDLAELTLGEKKARARRARARDFDKFANESDPQVLEILLRHPGIAQTHVLKILTRRPQEPAVIASVFRVPRWLGLPAIRRAMVYNPYSPTRISLRLLPLLLADDLAEAAAARDLHPLVREYAGHLHTLKGYTDSRALELSTEDSADPSE